ncbi:WD40 repeat domain-containing protein [Streptosporangium sp. NPDC023963]|uniref:WD40 repeat domain-containing protein n=1 Tax=Streptosporangium sp. NPDC023963 TaxID=3155608 RepID=UPI00344A456A
MALAGIGVVGSLGANLLSDVIGASLIAARARTRGGAQADAVPPANGPGNAAGAEAFAAELAGRVEQVEGELAARLEEILRAGDARAEALAETLAVVLSELQAAQVVISEAVASGEGVLLEEMVAGFAALGEQTAVLAPMLGRLDAAAGRIQRTLYRQDAEHRFDRSQRQRQEALLVVMREQLSEKLSALERRLPAGPNLLPEAGAGGGVVWMDGCPYQGLAPFGPAQAGVFYGRGQATARLAAMVTAHLGGEGLIVVTGASGAGKSSLLHAGLLPALAAAPLDEADSGGSSGGASWPQVTFTPGARPLQELAVQLAVRCNADPDTVLAELHTDPGRARGRARQILAAEAIRRYQQGATGAGPQRLVVVVDQFEEVFTPAADTYAGEAEAFVAALEAIATETDPVGVGPLPASPQEGARWGEDRLGGGPVGIVVLAVRGDFVDRCAAYPVLARALEERVFVLGPMSEQELQRAITGPAAAAGLAVEDGLAEQVVRELAGHTQPAGAGQAGVGALPLLSMAMVRTWHNREDGRLTRQGYDRSGGVASAVQDAAEEVYDAFDPHQREIAKRVITALTLTAADGQVARRRVAWGELAVVCEPGQPELTQQVIEAFAAARLMVTGPPSPAGSPDTITVSAAVPGLGEVPSDAPATTPMALTVAGTVELAHDVLVTAWPRLRSWLAEDQADRVLHGEILHDATEWDDAGRDASFLYRGIRLEAARHAATRWHADPGRYLGLSGPAEAFLHAAGRAATRTRHRWQALFVALAALLVIAIVTAGVAIRFGQEAEQQRAVALSRNAQLLSRQTALYSQSLLSGDPATSARLAAAAWAIAPTVEARRSMFALLSQPARAVLTGHTGEVTSAVFSPDGTRLASASHDRTVWIWDPATGQRVGAPLTGHTGRVLSVAFSPDGTRLASAGDDKTVRIWDPVTGKQVGAPLTGHTNWVYSVAFGPDGTRLASAGADGAVRIWDPVTGKQVGAPLTGHTSSVLSVAFGPDGTRLASAGDDKTVRIWDVATHLQVGAPLTGHTNWVYSVAFGPDGTRLASAGADKTVRIWDPVTGKQVGAPLTGHTSAVYSVAFSPDGTRLASAGADQTVRIWDVATHLQVGAPLTGHTYWVSSVAFALDGTRLVSAGFDGAVRVWDIVTHRQVGAPLSGHADSVSSVAFSPDGTRLASTGADQTVRIWDPVAGKQVGAPLTGHTSSVYSVAFSPDGTRLASAGDDKTVRIWDPVTGKQVGAPLTGHTRWVYSVAFSPDGTRLASAGDDKTVRIWDVATHQQVGAPLTGHTGRVLSVAFSPDGTRLASAGDDGAVRIWDVATHLQVGAPLTGHTSSVSSVAFSPDGTRLASTGADKTVRIWDPVTGKQVGVPLTGHTRWVSSVAFSPDGTRLASTGDDKTVRIWDVATHQQVGAPLTGHTDSVSSVAFALDGTRLASTGFDETVRIWDVALPRDLLRAVCGIAGRSITAQQWQRYIPGEPYRQSCPAPR